MEKTLKQCALDYAAMGFSVFPVIPPYLPNPTEPNDGKSPAVRWGTQATQDRNQIEQWWNKNPNYNIGIVCGKPSGGLVVIDLDIDAEEDVNGVNRFQKWAEENNVVIPQTASVKTGRGGVHLYFRDTLREYKNVVDLFKDKSGIDIRANGGYVIAPGSQHKTGNRYEWQNMPPLFAIQPLPTVLGDLIDNPPKDDSKATGNNQNSSSFSMPQGDIPEGARTNTLLRALASMQSKGFSDDAIRAAIQHENEHCTSPLADKELENTVFSALKRFEKGTAPYVFDREYDGELLKRLQQMQPEKNKRYSRSDAGNGNLFSDLCQGLFCYVPERKKWFIYDGKRWTEDSLNQVMEYCKNVANALMRYCTLYIEDEQTRSDYINHVKKWQQLHYRETILKDATTVAPISAGDFDADLTLLNCENGTLDLESGNFREHNSSDKITKLAAVTYDSVVKCERWERFITEVTCGDSDLATYIQKAMGYALTGDTRYECFFILYGATSRNGKSTLCETFTHLMGDYAKSANPETIGKKQTNNSNAATGDLARLAGARFVQMGEPDKGMVFNAALLKSLTGNDTITARFLYESDFQFRPQFKMFLNTNHLPYVSDVTLFSSDRVKVIPFNKHFTEDERDPNLKKELTRPENQSGILNWCLQGLRTLRKEGWHMPEAVREATQEYRKASDKAGQFIEDKLAFDSIGECETIKVHGLYQQWCIEHGFRAEGYNEFRKSLRTAGITMRDKRPEGAGRDAKKVSMILGYSVAE